MPGREGEIVVQESVRELVALARPAPDALSTASGLRGAGLGAAVFENQRFSRLHSWTVWNDSVLSAGQ